MHGGGNSPATVQLIPIATTTSVTGSNCQAAPQANPRKRRRGSLGDSSGSEEDESRRTPPPQPVPTGEFFRAELDHFRNSVKSLAPNDARALLSSLEGQIQVVKDYLAGWDGKVEGR